MQDKTFSNFYNWKFLLLYLTLTFGFSWTFWLFSINSPFYKLFIVIGAFGPSIGAILTIGFTRNKIIKKSFFQRCYSFKLISFKWLTFIILIFPVIMFLSLLISKFLGLENNYSLSDNFTGLVAFLIFIIIIFIAGPLSEELGWRGFLLDYLTSRFNLSNASIILGIIWILWHLPLFYLKGTSQYSLGLGTIYFWLWSIQVIMLSIIFTTVYYATNRSILSAILLHFMSNFTYSFFVPIGNSPDLVMEFLSTILHIILALLCEIYLTKKNKNVAVYSL